MRRWDSSVLGTFTEYLCSNQLATRAQGLKLGRVVMARDKDLEHELIILELEVVEIYLKEREKNKP